MLFNTVAVLAFATFAAAIQITAPTNTSGWTAGQAQTITWDSVSTDPSTFNLVLQIPNPAKTEKKTIQAGVQTSSGSYTYTPSEDAGDQYRVNFESTDSNAGILAQSDYFSIEAGNGASSSSSASGSSSAASSSSASGSTTPAKPTGTASGSTVPAGSIGTASASGSDAPKTTSGASALVPSLALIGGSIVALLL